MLNFGGSVKLNTKVIAIAGAFLLFNLILISNSYYSHNGISSTIDHYRTKYQKTNDVSQTIVDSKDIEGNILFEEHFKSSGDKKSYYEKYSMQYLPNYTGENLNHEESTLLVSLISSSAPYGRDRTYDQFFNDVLNGFNEDYGKISLGLLCITKDHFDTIKNYMRDFFQDERIEAEKKFNKVTMIYAPFLDENNASGRDDRQKPSFQKKRRSLIAKSRNFLINSILEFEKYILTIDSDIIEINPDTISMFITSKKDIIVPRIERGIQQDYDLNSWKGSRKVPTSEEFEMMKKSQQKAYQSGSRDEEYIFVPMDQEGKMEHLIDASNRLKSNRKAKVNELVEIDSVGGAVLFLKSEIWKLGIQFPPFYVIGTDWNLPLGGYDGIETEGLCYEAKILGYTCWSMPNLVAQHSEV
ncbi:hypothetical protein DASC09_008400 [Saccharomycopsis crataegensis]|uniref:Glycosyltransferase family 62 protein n=1 Tax=Saccharomycopsis crataegensis TaxID=43959 RepID=A0AAV5QGJ4_9ASCO|nr:hypothetical protein DASC09_008400 [Saccharomycopsis crataegensis]